MDKFITGALTAPIATVFIISGVLFLFICVVGNISGKIEPSVKSRIASGILGLLLIFTGLILHLNQEAPKIPAVVSTDQSKPDYTVTALNIATSKEAQPTSESKLSIPTIVDIESNDQITGAHFIRIGTAVRGTIATDKDRDFYKLEAPGNKTRVILRKLSRAGFAADLDVYDAVENKVKSKRGYGDTPVSLSFRSIAGSMYYIVIKSIPGWIPDPGDYELVVQKE